VNRKGYQHDDIHFYYNVAACMRINIERNA